MTTDPIQAARDALNAGRPGTFPIGSRVHCDRCDEELTADPRSGGYLFGSYGYGPCCAVEAMAVIKHYGEEGNIRARCPEGVSFADWIRGMRGPDAAITITPGLPDAMRLGGGQ